MAATQHTPLSRSAFHAGQYVKVQVSGNKWELGQIEALDDTRATIATSSGFSVTRGISSLVHAWLIVLDLNGVLGYRKSSKVFKKRPHVDALLEYLFRNFVVGVWTSCAEHNGVRIINDVFGEYEARLIFKMFRDECTPNPTAENRYGTFKDLRRVFERFSHFDSTNTIMVDDSEDKCSHRHNALCPTPYVGEESEGTAADEGLREIMAVLEQVLLANSLEPVRHHMLSRWDKEEQMSRQQSAATGGTLTGSLAPGGSGCFPGAPAPPPVPASSPFAAQQQQQQQQQRPPAAPAPVGAGSGAGGPAPPQPIGVGGVGSGSGKQSRQSARQQARQAAREAARVHARQDACDSDEDCHRPSVGNTPPVGLPPGAGLLHPTPGGLQLHGGYYHQQQQQQQYGGGPGGSPLGTSGTYASPSSVEFGSGAVGGAQGTSPPPAVIAGHKVVYATTHRQGGGTPSGGASRGDSRATTPSNLGYPQQQQRYASGGQSPVPYFDSAPPTAAAGDAGEAGAAAPLTAQQRALSIQERMRAIALRGGKR